MRFINKNNFATFQKNVTVSGTPVQLDTTIVDDGVSFVVKAKRANTGVITVGNSSANALNTGTGHFALQAGQSIELQVTNTNLVWIDSTVSGEGVEVVLEY